MRELPHLRLAAIVAAALILSGCSDTRVPASSSSQPDAGRTSETTAAGSEPASTQVTASQGAPPTHAATPPTHAAIPEAPAVATPRVTRSPTPTIPAAPANDQPPGTVIESLPFADSTNTSRAQIHAMEPSLGCGSGSRSVWYAYTAATDALVVVDTNGSDYDTLVDVWTGRLSADRMEPGFEQLTPLTCNDNTAESVQAQVAFQATAGTSYVIRVMAALESTGGTLRLAVATG